MKIFLKLILLAVSGSTFTMEQPLSFLQVNEARAEGSGRNHNQELIRRTKSCAVDETAASVKNQIRKIRSHGDKKFEQLVNNHRTVGHYDAEMQMFDEETDAEFKSLCNHTKEFILNDPAAPFIGTFTAVGLLLNAPLISATAGAAIYLGVRMAINDREDITLPGIPSEYSLRFSMALKEKLKQAATNLAIKPTIAIKNKKYKQD